jgi:multicomponent Na+:H+ antiporter subunit D
MTPEQLLQISLALPLLALVLNYLFSFSPNLRDSTTVVVASFLFYINICLAMLVFAGEVVGWDAYEMVPGFRIAFSIEPLGMLFALVASGLWILTTIYAIGYMRGNHEQHQTRFFGCFAVAIFAAVSAAYSQNLFTLFVAYELMTISTYPLVTHHGTAESRNGGRVYLGILFSTSIGFLMLALAWTYQIAGTLDFRLGGVLAEAYAAEKVSTIQLTILLALYAFGIGKAALMPVHRWLPAAMVAPTPVSALLHAVAVVKVGVFFVLKVAVFVFGIELLNHSQISVWLCYAAGISLVLASLVAMTKDNLKARLAYSTVGQLSYITLGAALATPSSVIGGGMHIAMHAVGKITLFFCAGAIYVATHKKNISEMRGLGRQMPFTFGAFLIASLCIIGLPPGGGAWSKWFLATGTVERAMDGGQTHFYFLTAALMISSLLNIAYLVPIPMLAFLGSPPANDHSESHDQIHGSPPDKSDPHGSHEPDGHHAGEAPLACVVPLCCTAIGSVILFFLADRIYEILLPITKS